jgi:hypothetical protein
MTNFLTLGDIQETTGNVPAIPGAAPSSTAGMQGNPAAAQYQPHGTYPGIPLVGGAGQTINAPLVHDTISRGLVPLSTQPTNAATAPGTDSLLAQMSRGQLSLNQSSYGQPLQVPNAGGQPVLPAPTVVPIVTGIGSAISIANPPNYIGN